MNLLYIAYSCDPYQGSEDRIGWRVPIESAKSNRVFVITKKEHEKTIETYLSENECPDITFFYVDIPRSYKRLFCGAFYSGRLKIWNRAALKRAKSICEQEKIDVIHQITPVEFRAIGNYHKISGPKFVCGPVAGGQTTPKALKGYTKKYAMVEMVRAVVNWLCKARYVVSRKLEKCDYIFFANRETKEYLKDAIREQQSNTILTDVSIDAQIHQDRDRAADRIRFAVIGRLVYLKGHAFLLDALARIPADLNWECCIVGTGSEREDLVKKCAEYGLDKKVTFSGPVAHTEISKVYRNTDVLIMPSLREATGTVLIEAMAHGVPVVTIKRFGGADLLDEQVAWLYDGETQEACIENLKNSLIACILNPGEVTKKGKNAQIRVSQYTWEKKNAVFQCIYKQQLS